jgi:hypothetical protein
MRLARPLAGFGLLLQSALWGWVMLSVGPMPATARRYLLGLILVPLAVAALQVLRSRAVLGIAVLYGLASAALFGFLAFTMMDPDGLAAGGSSWAGERLRMLAAAGLSAFAAFAAAVAWVRRT